MFCMDFFKEVYVATCSTGIRKRVENSQGNYIHKKDKTSEKDYKYWRTK